MLSLIAKIGANVSGFMRGMDEIKGAAKKTGDQIASNFGNNLKNSLFGGLTIGAAAAFGKSLLDNAGRINDLAEQYGLAAGEVQSLSAAAELSGLEFERVAGAIERLGAARKDAATKNESLRTEFAKFGVTLQDLQNPAKSNLDLLKQIGNALQGIEITPATREALGEIVGEKGKRLLEFIKGINETKPLSLVTTEQLDLLDKFGDKLAGIARQVTELAQATLADVIADSQNPDKARQKRLGVLFDPEGFVVSAVRSLFGSKPQTTSALTAEEVTAARAALAPGGELFKKEEDASKKAKAVSAISTIGLGAPPPAGGLASAGLFFGGAGSMLYRETKTQTEIQRQSLQELRRLQAVIREEL